MIPAPLKKKKKSDIYIFFRLLVNWALSQWESIMGGLNKHKLTLGKMHRCSLSHSHFICEGASHSNLIPVFLYQRKGGKKKKKTTSRLILREYILQCVHLCVRARVCVCERADLPRRRWYWRQKIFLFFFFFCFFPLDLFSNVDVYHLSRTAIHLTPHPPPSTSCR